MPTQPTWKTVMQWSWWPNAILFVLVSWLVLTNDSVPQRNARELEKIEQRLELTEKLLSERTPTFDAMRKFLEKNQ